MLQLNHNILHLYEVRNIIFMFDRCFFLFPVPGFTSSFSFCRDVKRKRGRVLHVFKGGGRGQGRHSRADRHIDTRADLRQKTLPWLLQGEKVNIRKLKGHSIFKNARPPSDPQRCCTHSARQHPCSIRSKMFG